MKDNNEIREELMQKLEQKLIGMDIPELRKRDVHWLGRNILINNADHPNIMDALWAMKDILEFDQKQRKSNE